MELRILGTVEVVGENGPVPLPAAKQRLLLVALVLADGRSRSADELIDAVWGEAPPASARKLLQVYVSQLRKLLPSEARLVTRPAGYALELPDGALDATRFEQLLGEGRHARAAGNPVLAASLLRRALALWRGPALADVADGDAPHPQAARFEELRLGCLEDRIAAELDLGRHDEVLAELAPLVASHPLRERLRAHQMLALHRAGRQAEALEVFQEARRALVEELGLEPSVELRTLQQRILGQDPTLEATRDQRRSSVLPLPPGPLVGRRRELEALHALLAERDVRLLVLTGAGGSGKTRLALEAAHRAGSTFANGAVLVELASLRDPALVAATIASALEVVEVAGEAPETTLEHALSDRELLLLVDNAEHLREAAPLLARLVSRAPRLTVMVTSRAVLHVSGEHVFPVAPLAEEDAVELFVQRARLLEPAFGRTEVNDTEVREICRRLDGLPLAIELAAARIRTLTPRDLVERLGERLALLTSGPRDLPARQQTLRETIDWSVGLLSDAERRVLARLAVFPAGATLEAAEAVCGAGVDSLAALVDGNVVRRVDANGDSRFGLIETIREFALEQLGDDRDETERALALHMLDLVEQAHATMTEDPGWMARLDAELDNLRLALDVAAREDSDLELRLAGGLWRYWWTRGYLDEGLVRLEAVIGRETEESPARVRAVRGAAGLAWSLGDLELAEARAREALDLAHAIDSPDDALGAHTILGIVANQRKDFETARHHHEQSLAIKVSLGREPAVEKLNLALVALDAGDAEDAVVLLEEVLAMHRRSDNRSGIGFATLNLGLAQYRLGNTASAVKAFEEAYGAFSEVGFRAHVGHALQGLAGCEASCGRHAGAARLLGQAAVELGEIVQSEDDFPLLAAEVEIAAREALGDDAFEEAHAQGRSGAPSDFGGVPSSS